MPSPTTKDRILDAAESLFAAKGFAATSLRLITTDAQVNLAAVHYHFGSKEALFQAVFARRVGPINIERLATLDQLEAETGTEGPSLECVLEAFLGPAVRLAHTPRGQTFMRLAGRTYTEPGDHWVPVASQFDEVKARFLRALQRRVPDLPPTALFWRAHFMIGVMCHTLADTHRLHHISAGLCDPSDSEATLAHLVPFLAAGFRAAVPSLQPGGHP